MSMQSIPKALANIQDNSTSHYNSSLLREIMNYNKSKLKLFQIRNKTNILIRRPMGGY